MKWFDKICLMVVFLLALSSCKKGCTDPEALNYNDRAEDDNGSCVYEQIR